MQTTILWHSSQLATTEHCVITDDATGVQIHGQVFQAAQGVPVRITYALTLDRHWRTRQVQVLCEAVQEHNEIDLSADGLGNWWQHGQPLYEMVGCLDVDLGITPLTNTLPIRRLGLQSGMQAAVDAVWVRFPDLTLACLPQQYTCVDTTHYHYASDSFQADLLVDEQGFVQQYGDTWRAIAYAVA